MTAFDLWPLPLGGGAWGAGTNMWHPETPASYESLPVPLATQIPTLWIDKSGGRGRGGALILDRCRAIDLFASVDAHLWFLGLMYINGRFVIWKILPRYLPQETNKIVILANYSYISVLRNRMCIIKWMKFRSIIVHYGESTVRKLSKFSAWRWNHSSSIFLSKFLPECYLWIQNKAKKPGPSFKTFKGTQEWEFFRLQFWILYYLIVSYSQILRFCKKIFWSGHYWGRYDYSA
jgi:hypothetical protein